MQRKTEQFIGKCIGPSVSGAQSHRYLITSLLGKQKGRRTFLAKDAETRALVVLKLILFGADFTWEDLKLFEREAETLKSLEHSAIPTYLDSFETKTAIGEGFVLVQSYIEAKSLAEWVTTGRRFSELELKEIAQSILLILQYLHSRHPAVVHRDLKPSNILLADRSAHSVGKVYLVDFGSVQVAQHGGTMTVVGTYGYMPPEQFGGRSSPASDLYSLGATLVYLASGRQPADFTEPSLEDAIASTSLGLSLHFTQWIQQLTKASVAQRTSSAAIALHNLTSSALNDDMSFQEATVHPNPNSLGSDTSSVTKTDLSNTVKSSALGFSSIANGSFKIRSTEQNFILRFHQHRIEETISIKEQLSPVTWSIPTLLLCFILLMIFATVSGALGLLLAIAFLSIPLWSLLLSQSSYSKHPGRAELSLSKSTYGAVLLAVRVMDTAANQRGDGHQSTASYLSTQFTNIPVQSACLQPTRFRMPVPFGHCVTFTFAKNDRLEKPTLSVIGNRQEMQELLDSLCQWDNDIVAPHQRY